MTGQKNSNKALIASIEAHTLRDLLNKVNSHNTEYPNKAILKEDVLKILKEEGTYILLYYKA